MEQQNEIVNRVAASPLITFDLDTYYVPGERVVLDIKDQLFQEAILREKDFRLFIKTHDWEQYRGKFVAVYCSVDAIIPAWAYMLVGIALESVAAKVVFGSKESLETELFNSNLQRVDWSSFKDQKVVVKGCSKTAVPHGVFLEIATRLKPFVSSLMFGEPCSTVPLYKRK